MPGLPNYAAFAGRHYETGTLSNALAWQGVRLPRNEQSPSEALLFGIGGGIAVGYFTFAYKGYPPHVALLTRNTFNAFDTILDRLAIPRDVRQTADAAKAESALISAIEEGAAPIVWPDAMSLPYTNTPWDERNWSTAPLIVFGMEGESALLAAGSSQPLRVDRSVLSAARGRVKADRFRMMELDAPNFDLLPDAVYRGIRQCIALFTDAPPRGKRENFGAAALEQWAKMMRAQRGAHAWARQFPRGSALYQALLGTPWQPGLPGWIMTWGTSDGADRATYANFLDESAAILGIQALQEVATLFRNSHRVWNQLAESLAPPSGILREAHTLLIDRHRLFVEHGDIAQERIRAMDERLFAIQRAATAEFPLNENEVHSLLEELAAKVDEIRSIEVYAFRALQEVIEQ